MQDYPLLLNKKGINEPTGKITGDRTVNYKNNQFAVMTTGGGFHTRSDSSKSKSPIKVPFVVDSEQHRAELMSKEQQKVDYRAVLLDQMQQKEDQKRAALLRKREEDERLMNEFHQFRVGSKNQGGGSPMRDGRGDVITQHAPFASALSNEGAIHQHLARIQSAETVGSRRLGTSFSPNRNEILHMRPSNYFEDITEDEFNRREQNKHSYKNELFSQMAEARDKKEAERMKRLREDILEEERLKQ